LPSGDFHNVRPSGVTLPDLTEPVGIPVGRFDAGGGLLEAGLFSVLVALGGAAPSAFLAGVEGFSVLGSFKTLSDNCLAVSNNFLYSSVLVNPASNSFGLGAIHHFHASFSFRTHHTTAWL